VSLIQNVSDYLSAAKTRLAITGRRGVLVQQIASQHAATQVKKGDILLSRRKTSIAFNASEQDRGYPAKHGREAHVYATGKEQP